MTKTGYRSENQRAKQTSEGKIALYLSQFHFLSFSEIWRYFWFHNGVGGYCLALSGLANGPLPMRCSYLFCCNPQVEL